MLKILIKTKFYVYRETPFKFLGISVWMSLNLKGIFSQID